MFEVMLIVIVIGQLEHNVFGNCNWYFCNQLWITISFLY